MEEIGTLLGGIVDLRAVLLAVGLALLALLAGFLIARSRRALRKAPGHHMVYRAASRTAAECRGLLGTSSGEDLFRYQLEATPKGGWYLNLKEYRPGAQIMDTVFLLQFENDSPAVFSLEFVSEAFGMREPLAPPALLDSFFAAKLGAERCDAPSGGQ